MFNNYLEEIDWKAYTQYMNKWTRLLKPLMEKPKGGASEKHFRTYAYISDLMFVGAKIRKEAFLVGSVFRTLTGYCITLNKI